MTPAATPALLGGDAGVVVCGGTRWIVRRVFTCPVCGHRGRIVMHDPGGYWSVSWTCCTCGDSWSDGELRERPFRRGWRTEAQRRAKADWARGISRAQWLTESWEHVMREFAE